MTGIQAPLDEIKLSDDVNHAVIQSIAKVENHGFIRNSIRRVYDTVSQLQHWKEQIKISPFVFRMVDMYFSGFSVTTRKIVFHGIPFKVTETYLPE